MSQHPVDLDDVSHCPLGVRCESCGAEAPDLAVAISESPVGAFCVSACACCAAAIGRGTPVPVALATAVRLAAQHAEHRTAGQAEEG
jgi:hypothetical protein